MGDKNKVYHAGMNIPLLKSVAGFHHGHFPRKSAWSAFTRHTSFLQFHNAKWHPVWCWLVERSSLLRSQHFLTPVFRINDFNRRAIEFPFLPRQSQTRLTWLGCCAEAQLPTMAVSKAATSKPRLEVLKFLKLKVFRLLLKTKDPGQVSGSQLPLSA